MLVGATLDVIVCERLVDWSWLALWDPVTVILGVTLWLALDEALCELLRVTTTIHVAVELFTSVPWVRGVTPVKFSQITAID